MKLNHLQDQWDSFARSDPLWAVLTNEDMKGGLWNETDFFRTGESDVARVFQRLEEMGVKPTQDTALDFGCGMGRLTAALASRFTTVDAVDISSEMLRQAAQRRTWPDHVRFIHCDDTKLSPLGDTAYSFVLSLISLQHIPPHLALRYLSSLCRCLRPGGIAYLQLGTFLNPAEPAALAKLRRDESRLHQIYRLVHEQVNASRHMRTFYCRLSEVMKVLEKNRIRLITVLPDDSMGGPFVSHCLIVQKPGHSTSANE